MKIEAQIIIKTECGITHYMKGHLIHREDGPAIEINNGTKFWLQNGKYHRLDGPAQEYASGNKQWYFNGDKIEVNSQKEFERWLKFRVYE